jgi:PleD family two-component response regulator
VNDTEATNLGPEVPGAGHRQVILVVDDDDFQRKFTGRILQSEGFEVCYAAGGRGALDLSKSRRIDLILMDLLMPDMNGLDVITQLSTEGRLARIPVIMITGNSEREIVLRSLEVGAVDFIVKPLDRATLLAKIRRAL